MKGADGQKEAGVKLRRRNKKGGGRSRKVGVEKGGGNGEKGQEGES